MERKKFYTFTAGQKVPRWMMGVRPKNRIGELCKTDVRFAVSCICVRVPGKKTLLMVASGPNNGQYNCQINVLKGSHIFLGGENGASGVFLLDYSRQRDAYKLYNDHISETDQ